MAASSSVTISVGATEPAADATVWDVGPGIGATEPGAAPVTIASTAGQQPPQTHALTDEQILAQLDHLERKLLSLQDVIRDLRVQVQARSEGHATHEHVSDRRSGAGADSDPPQGFHYAGRLRFPRTPPGSPRRPATLADNGPAAVVSPATLADGGPASPDVPDDLSPTSSRSQSCISNNSTASTVPYAW